MPAIEVNPRDIYEKEIIERFIEGLKLAVSCSKEMQEIQPKRGWGDVTNQLNGMVMLGHKLARAKGITRQALLAHADQIQAAMGIQG